MKREVYFITGVSGLIGSSIVKKIMTFDAYQRGKILVLGAVRNRKRALEIFKGYDCINFEVIEEDILGLQKWVEILQSKEMSPDYMIHCAAPTKSSYMVVNPVETVDSIVNGTKNMLELAKMFKIKSMVYLSSMEVFGNIDCSDGRRVEENELGDINLYDVRSCYSLGKRMAENLCYLYHKEYGVPVKNARLAQVFGRGILQGESRVFAQFANAVRKKTNIVLHTQGNSMGNYCDIEDAVSAILIILNSGANGEVYNVVNQANTMTIRQMAEMVATEVAKGTISVEYNIPEENLYGYAPATGLRMSSKKIETLGWKPTKDLASMYCEMIDYMNECEFP